MYSIHCEHAPGEGGVEREIGKRGEGRDHRLAAAVNNQRSNQNTMNDGHMSISQCSLHKTLQGIDSLFFNMSRNIKLHLVSIACVGDVI